MSGDYLGLETTVVTIAFPSLCPPPHLTSSALPFLRVSSISVLTSAESDAGVIYSILRSPSFLARDCFLRSTLQEPNVYLLSGGFGSERVRGVIKTCSRTTGELKPRNPRPTLTRFGQPSQERLILDQMRKLTVRLLVDVSHPRIDKSSVDTRTCSRNSARYDPVPPRNIHLTGW